MFFQYIRHISFIWRPSSFLSQFSFAFRRKIDYNKRCASPLLSLCAAHGRAYGGAKRLLTSKEGSFMYSIFRNLALILISAKFFALLARKCRAPQVVGEIIAGLVIGPCLLNLVQPSDSIAIFAEIGVVLLMFTTGLGTNLQELMRAGPIATLIACVGVAVPLAGGTLLYSLFYGFSALGSPEFYNPTSLKLSIVNEGFSN